MCIRDRYTPIYLSHHYQTSKHYAPSPFFHHAVLCVSIVCVCLFSQRLRKWWLKSPSFSSYSIPPTVNYLQCLVTGSTLTAVGSFQLPAPQSGTLSWILSGTRPSVETVLGVCVKRICSLDTSAFSALEVLDDNCAL